MKPEEATVLLYKTETDLNLLLLRLSRMNKEIGSLKRDLTEEEEQKLTTLAKHISAAVKSSPVRKASPGPDDLGWGPI